MSTQNQSPTPEHAASAAGWRPGATTFRSWLILAASLGLALSIYYGFLASSLVDRVAEWTAQWTSHGLNLLGTPTHVNGTVLSSGSFAVNIVAECTAVGPLVLFIGAVFAYPATMKARAIGVTAGLAALTLINLVRIISLFLLGSAYPEFLEIAHLLVWQTAIILFAIVLWLLWVERVAGARHR